MSLIDARNLSKIYQSEGVETAALKEVTLRVNRGDFVAVMGPSGSGKSTLLHLLGLLDTPTSGSYFFDGKGVSSFSENEQAKLRNEKIGFVFQSFNLLPRTTVIDNIRMPLLYSSIPETEWESRIERAIEAVGLQHRMRHESGKLSGGEKQRVAIARALVCNPAILFADEPTGNLDSKSGGLVMETLSKLNDAGHTIVLITHETYTAEHARRIIHLKDGCIEKEGQVAERRRGEPLRK